MTYAGAAPAVLKPSAAPEEAPNILLVLLDDVGFGVLSTFGGLVESPTLDRLAKDGLRYTRFHTAGLPASTSAALLTGRNHHVAGMGVNPERATGFPGYAGAIPRSCATVAEVLRQNGYATGWWGWNDTIPAMATTIAGPFDAWPHALGFDYFYGTVGAPVDQFAPSLFRNTTAVDPPRTPEQGYHFTTDIANDCIRWIQRQKAIAPGRPLFAFVAPGCGQAPHQPPLGRRGRHAGRFDFGWDEYRRRVFERQVALGVVPPSARLTPRPDAIPSWESVSPEERRVFARLFENYADFVEHGDDEIGRILDAIAELSELENTLVVYIAGSNGCSAEGASGTLRVRHTLDGFDASAAELLSRIDEIGTPGTWPHMPAGWAWAGNSPFTGAKGSASHLGGIRNPMVVCWPARVREAGAVRSQFHHISDLGPTLLEAAGIAEPAMVNGVAQRAMDGMSLVSSFETKRTSAGRSRTTQYFEMFGSRAIYRDGWMASCRHEPGHAFDDDRWELYHLDEDFSQSSDLAGREPTRLRALQDAFIAEAARNDVFPLDDRLSERLDASRRGGWFSARRRVTLIPGMVRLPESAGLSLSNVTHAVTAKLRVPSPSTEGVIVCCGGASAGWSVYVLSGRLTYHYNFFDLERFDVVADRDLPTGDIEINVRVMNETPTRGGPARVELFIDGEPAGSGRIERQVRTRFSDEGIDVGIDTGSPVSRAYRDRRGFPFTGVIERVTFELDGDATPVQAPPSASVVARDRPATAPRTG